MMIPSTRCDLSDSKMHVVVAVFTMALAALLVAILASPARADKIGPPLPGMMIEFDSVDDCVPYESGGGDPGDPGPGDGEPGEGNDHGGGPPAAIFGRADHRSGFKYAAKTAGTISGFSIQAPAAYDDQTCEEVVDSFPLKFGVLRKVPGSEYKYAVVASESKIIESAPIGQSSVIRHVSVAPMTVQAGDVIAFGIEPDYDYDNKARLSGFFALGVGGYEDDLGYGCVQPMTNGATLQCVGPLNQMAANEEDFGPKWASLRILMNADFHPAPVTSPKASSQGAAGGPVCNRADYKATLKTYKTVAAKYMLRKGVPVEIDANQSGKATVDVLVRTKRDVKKWLGKGKKAKRLIARKRIKLSAGKTRKSKLRLTKAARSQLKKALKKRGRNSLRLLVKAKLDLGDKKLSKLNNKKVSLKKNTKLTKRGSKPRSKTSTSRSKIGRFTNCAAPLKIKVKKVGGKKLKWSDLVSSKGVRVQLKASTPATVKLKLAMWGRSLTRLRLAKKNVKSKKAKTLAAKSGIKVNSGTKVVYRLKLSSSQRKRLKRARKRAKRTARTTVYFKLEATGEAQDKKNMVRDRRHQTLKLRVGRKR